MALFKKTKTDPKESFGSAAPARVGDHELFRVSGAKDVCERELYSKLKREVPIIEACIEKIIRLCGGFRVVCENERFQAILDDFSKNVKVGTSGRSLKTYVDVCLDSLLTYGCSLSEIVYDVDKTSISGLYCAPSKQIHVKEGKTPFEREYLIGQGKEAVKLRDREDFLFMALNPTPETPDGKSILSGLPSLSAILLRIYESIGQNFDRIGNVRYAVTYKPSGDSADKAFAKERAKQIAKEWSSGMSAAKSGEIRDFVAVGDVDIKVIGADNQLIDTEVPVRQLLEQIVSKLGIPPFLLGLNWSTSERMSTQQTDILTSELEHYRRLICPAIEKICERFLRTVGSCDKVYVEWDSINLQDEVELSVARLNNAKARSLELENEKASA